MVILGGGAGVLSRMGFPRGRLETSNIAPPLNNPIRTPKIIATQVFMLFILLTDIVANYVPVYRHLYTCQATLVYMLTLYNVWMVIDIVINNRIL